MTDKPDREVVREAAMTDENIIGIDGRQSDQFSCASTRQNDKSERK
jgi:hypothetical protein